MSSRKHYPALDGLRAYSALGIIVMHVLTNGGFSLGGFVFERLIPSLAELVFLFMILSSFGLCCGYYETVSRGQFDAEGFYRKRLVKIWPFFALMCLFECAVSFSLDALWETFANLSMCFGFLDRPMQVIGVGWFLGVVMIFYMIFPFFCCLIRDKKRAWLALGIAAALCGLSEFHFGLERRNFAFCFVFFVAGGVLYLYREKLEVSFASCRWLWLLFSASVAAGWYALGCPALLSVVLYALIAIYALGSSGKLLNNPLTRFLSGISMELYLCHMPVYRVLEKLEVTQLFGGGIWAYALTCLLTVLGAVCVSFLYQKAVKRLTTETK